MSKTLLKDSDSERGYEWERAAAAGEASKAALEIGRKEQYMKHGSCSGASESRVRGRRFAVVGAGAAGLCSAKYLVEAGFEDVTIFELGSQIGGLWCYNNDNGLSSAYRTLHINSPRRLTHFHDFPFKEGVQHFPSHWEMQEYLVDYAHHFDLVRRIKFKTPVKDVRPSPDYNGLNPCWLVETTEGDIFEFDRIIIASGHLSKPLHVEEYRQGFTGEYMHSHYYKEPREFVGKRVCVIGAGNSACDIASDICVTAEKTVMVARSGVRIAPKLIFGRPFPDFITALEKPWIPNWLRERVIDYLIYLIQGRMTDLGFKPLTRRAHPTSSAVLVQHIAYRRVVVKQGIEGIEGNKVRFSDGSSEEFDVLVGCTGYLIDVPFLKPDVLEVKNNALRLYKRIVPVEWRGLYFVGFLNTTTSLPNAFEHQMRWLIPLEKDEAVLPTHMEMWEDIRGKEEFLAQYYQQSLRHTIEEPHLVYLPELMRSIRELRSRKRKNYQAAKAAKVLDSDVPRQRRYSM